MISVVIILKNDLGVVDTIKGLNRQDFKGKFEIIVVDRSTIKYPKIVSKVPLRWISFDAKGKRYTIPEQRNEGIKQSIGEIVVFIDASCVPNKNWLTEIIKPIKEQGEKIVMGNTGSIGGVTLNDLAYEKLKNTKHVSEAPTINLAIAKEVFGKVGIFDTALEYGSDVDFAWRSIKAGLKISYQKSAYIAHNWGEAKEETKRTVLYGKARARILIKHFSTHWRNLLGKDSPVILYPILILLLPVTFSFPWYPLVFFLLVLKNIREPNPAGIVLKHIIYGWGVLIELKDQIIKWLKKS
jgi:GT2 family glycosyltransferase